MNTTFIWLAKAMLSHLLTDLLFQPSSWVEDRKRYHLRSYKLYLHGLTTGIVLWIFLGFQYLPAVMTVTITHTLIDGWKSYKKDSSAYFMIDQLLHIVVIACCWLFLFQDRHTVVNWMHDLQSNLKCRIFATAIVFLTTHAGVLIGKLTSKWRDAIDAIITGLLCRPAIQ